MLPQTMKAMLLTAHGGPETLAYRDVPVPTPDADEVLVEVGACGMNNTDIWVREGAYGSDDDPGAVSSWRRDASALAFPRIQGADIAGRIVDVGALVPRTRIGERVMVDFNLYNDPSDSLANVDYIGHARDGGFAEYVSVPAQNAHAVDTPLSDAELATFCCAYVTGEHMLNRGRVGPKERVLITGASGGVGSGLIQLCNARGAIPIAVAGAAKAQAVAAIGPAAVVIRGSGDFKRAVRDACRGAPIDVVADVVGGPLFPDLLSLVRPEGRLVTAGAIGGPVIRLDLRTVYLKHVDVIGCSQGTRKAFLTVLGYVLDGRIRPLLAATYPLSQLARAQDDFKRKQFVGKLVVVPDRLLA
jgi:alcohol dehydrogenase